jgi:hypothetical protein
MLVKNELHDSIEFNTIPDNYQYDNCIIIINEEDAINKEYILKDYNNDYGDFLKTLN